MDSRWYQAQTLNERLVSFRAHGSSNGTDSELANKRLERWKTGAAFSDDAIFQRFLCSIKVSENEFKEILGQNKEQIREVTGRPLAWVNGVLECLNSKNDLSSFESSRDFLALVDPLISHFRAKLQAHVVFLQSASQTHVFHPDTLVNLLTEEIAARLRWTIRKTLILETNIARMENRLSGETKRERYESFIRLIGANESRLSIYLEYPVLTRRVWQMLEQWFLVSSEFIERLNADYGLLNERFGLDSTILVAITGAGDLHCQGRSVQILEFANKKKLVYKPRSLALDDVFSDLLQFLSARGLKPGLRIPETVDRGRYGWSEHISQHDCQSEAQIKKFYERIGVWLALLYLLGANDLHLENLIASGEFPIVIDLETVFHPELRDSTIESADDLAMNRLFDSVMDIGLLPTPLRKDGGSMDISGIGAKPDQVVPFNMDIIEDEQSDEIFVGKAPARIGKIYSNPCLSGAIIEPAKYHRYIKKGFAAAYRLLQDLSGELRAKGGWFERFSKLPIRVIVRPTPFYSQFLVASLHPHFNHRGLDQDFNLRDLWAQTKQDPIYERLIASECCQLILGDIPYFSTTPDSKDIIGGDGTVIASVLAKSGLELSEGRFRRMSESDLSFQLWLIDATLQSMSLENAAILQAKGYPRKCTDFLDAAIACGDRLVETAITYMQQSSWICLSLAGEKEHGVSYCKLGIIEQDLYRGSLGIALFLAYLYSLTGVQCYKEIAEGCLNQARANQYSKLRMLGAYGGLCGLVYVNMHLAALFKYNDLDQRTHFAIDLLPALIESDSMLDLIYGCAGAIPVLLAYSSYFPDSNALELARACGDKLLNEASTGIDGKLTWKSLNMPRGFSHGLSGIAFGLSGLARATNDEKYYSAFTATLTAEDELLKGNRWTDFLENPQGIAWCHGAAGIALSRMRIYQEHGLAQAKEEALRALHFLLGGQAQAEHSICHGSLGNLEPLLLASEIFGEQTIWQTELQLRSKKILKDINSSGWKSRLASQVSEPGLMTGLAGIGFEFLRLHASRKVPSILLLDRPL